MIKEFNVIVIGAGAAGLMSAIEAGKRGRKVLLLDHAKKLVRKSEFQVEEDVILQISILMPVNLFLKIQILLNLH